MKPAQLISRLFDPLILFGVLGVTSALRNLSDAWLVRFLVVFFLGIVLPPAGLLFWAVKTKRVNNWDVSNRRQRIKVLTAFLLMTFIDLFLVKLFGNEQLLRLFFLFTVWFLGFFAITLFWKISGHVAAITLTTLEIIRWYGFGWWPLLLTIPLVGWARIASRNHSVAQVIEGAVYSLVVFWLQSKLQFSI